MPRTWTLGAAESSTLFTKAPFGRLTPQLALAHPDNSPFAKTRPESAHACIGSFSITFDPSLRTIAALTFAPRKALEKISSIWGWACSATPSRSTKHSDVDSPRTFIGSALANVEGVSERVTGCFAKTTRFTSRPLIAAKSLSAAESQPVIAEAAKASNRIVLMRSLNLEHQGSELHCFSFDSSDQIMKSEDARKPPVLAVFSMIYFSRAKHRGQTAGSVGNSPSSEESHRLLSAI
jgi:hypothetical protein